MFDATFCPDIPENCSLQLKRSYVFLESRNPFG
jgi:hypothetical protein